MAALLTTGATVIIFEERFFRRGVDIFPIYPLALYYLHLFPQTVGRSDTGRRTYGTDYVGTALFTHIIMKQTWKHEPLRLERILVPLDGSDLAENSLPVAQNNQ